MNRRHSAGKSLFYAVLKSVVTEWSDSPEKVFLTFDDGPHAENTDKILEILQNEGAKATFFVNGVGVQRYPEIVCRIAEGGHEVASHGWFHRRYSHFTFEELRRQIVNAEEIIHESCGVTTRNYRPPYGRLTIPLLYYAWKRDMKIVMWSLDSEDDRGQSARLIIENCRRSREGDIILFHDDNRAILEALPEVVREMRSRGLKFGTVREIFEGGGRDTRI